MEQAEGNDFNSISSSRNLGNGIYTVIRGDIYCPRTPPSVAAGEAASPASSVHPAFAYLSCVVQSLPTGFSCCQWWERLLWISLGDFSLHPARPLGLGPALFLQNTYFTFSKGGQSHQHQIIQHPRQKCRSLVSALGFESLGTAAGSAVLTHVLCMLLSILTGGNQGVNVHYNTVCKIK